MFDILEVYNGIAYSVLFQIISNINLDALLTETYIFRHPALAVKISELMEDYMQALRSKDETPGSLLSLTREAEEAILDKYKAQVITMQEGKMKTADFFCTRPSVPVVIKLKKWSIFFYHC